MTGNGGIAAVVLAAGASTRMGRPKQLMMHDGKPLLTRATDAVRGADLHPVVVVLGAHADEIRPAIGDARDVSIVVNTKWQTGIASSIATGLQAIAHEPWDGVLLTLGDQPLITARTVQLLVQAFRRGTRLVAASYGGAPGVPAIFGAEHVPELTRLTGDTGARNWLLSHADRAAILQLGEALLDVDTPADAQRLATRTRSG